MLPRRPVPPVVVSHARDPSANHTPSIQMPVAEDRLSLPCYDVRFTISRHFDGYVGFRRVWFGYATNQQWARIWRWFAGRKFFQVNGSTGKPAKRARSFSLRQIRGNGIGPLNDRSPARGDIRTGAGRRWICQRSRMSPRGSQGFAGRAFSHGFAVVLEFLHFPGARASSPQRWAEKRAGSPRSNAYPA